MSLLLVTAPLPPMAIAPEYGWALSGDDGIALRSEGRAPLALLPQADELALGLPSAALSWHQVKLPQGSLGSAARLRSVLDGLLEERLLDDPDQLHFALEPGAETGRAVWVAACNRHWLRSLVQAIEASGRRVLRIVPEFAPQPDDAPPLVFATGDAAAPQITRCNADGVATLPLSQAGLAMMGAPGSWATAVVSAEPAVAELTEQLLGRRVPIVKTPQRWLQATRSPWELAQFDLAVTGRARAGKQAAALWQTLRHAPRWRAARWGALLLIVAQLVGLNAWAWKERRSLEAKRQTVDRILTQTFPAVQPVVDAPLQMARAVSALSQATGELSPADFEPMLSSLAASLPPGKTPTAIDFGGGQLRLRGLGLQPTELAPLQNALAPRGYNVRTEGDLLLVQAEVPR